MERHHAPPMEAQISPTETRRPQPAHGETRISATEPPSPLSAHGDMDVAPWVVEHRRDAAEAASRWAIPEEKDAAEAASDPAPAALGALSEATLGDPKALREIEVVTTTPPPPPPPVPRSPSARTATSPASLPRSPSARTATSPPSLPRSPSARVPVLLCKKGCGFPAAKGHDRKGRPLTTCCRTCAVHGFGHDNRCTSRQEKDRAMAAELQASEYERLQRQRSGSPGRGRGRRFRRRISKTVEYLWDPVWGEIELEKLGPSTWQNQSRHRRQCFAMALFSLCPCLMVTCRCCFWKEVHKGLSPAEVRQGWQRIMLSWSMLFSVVQIASLVGSACYYGQVMLGRGFPCDADGMRVRLQAFDEMGAKNAARMVYDDEWWRLITPMFLHGGCMHLLGNLVIQLRTGVVLEVLWGHTAFLVIYVLSGATGFVWSCILKPDSLTVGCSGALFGILGAWPPFILITWNQTSPVDRMRRDRQLGLVAFSLFILILLSFEPMIDYAAHFGGLAMGAALSLLLFANRLQSDRWMWATHILGFLSFLLIACLGCWRVLEIAPNAALLDI